MAGLYFFVYAVCECSPKADTLTIEQVKNMSLEDLLLLDFPQELMRKYMEVISATKNSQKISQPPAIISVITSQQIRQRGYGSVAEALASLPSLGS